MAIGHSGASKDVITDAVSAGATMSTHLGNGCSDILPRHPNVLWTQLAEDRLVAGLIVDGIHLPPEMVKAMVRAKTLDRVILVTDAVTCAGCPPGRYRLGPLEVELSPEGVVWSPTSGTLAGSSLLLPNGVANLCRFTGVAIEDALPLASTRPAAYVGEEPRGTLDLDWDSSTATLLVDAVHL